MLNARCTIALSFARSRSLIKPKLFARLCIIQIQRSFNQRFFSRHTTNFAAGSAGPKDLELAAHLLMGVSYCGQPNGLALAKGRTRSKFCLVFQLFWCFYFFLLFCLIYVTVRNTNYYLCFSQFEIECVCVFFFCVSVQLIEEKYCCDCFFSLVCEFVKQDWDLTKRGVWQVCEKILLQLFRVTGENF